MDKNISMEQRLALDASARRIDENGYLHVPGNHITKAVVNPYYGREIPGWEDLGLDPEKVYYGLRDPEELAKAVGTFSGLPLQADHHPDSAEDPQTEFRVGSVGTDVRWEPPYIVASLCVWDADAIEAIKSGRMREISCAYRYEPDFTPGEYEGTHYDFVMRDIRGNHVALVEEGRAGPDVVVADKQLELKHSTSLKGMLMSIFKRFRGALDESPEVEQQEVDLAQAIIDLHKVDPRTGEVVDVVEDEDKAAKIRDLIEGLSASMTPEEKKQLLDALNDLAYSKATGDAAPDDKAESADAEPLTTAEAVAYGEKKEREREEREEMAGGKDEAPLNTPEAVAYGEKVERDRLMREHMQKAAKDCGLDAESEEFQKAFAEGVKYGESKDCAQDEDQPAATTKEIKTAMDSALKKAVREARAQSVEHFRALSAAADDTRHVLGNIDALAFDSADDIYGAALRKMGVNVNRHPRSAWRSMFSVMKGRDAENARVAMDSMPTGEYDGVFSGLKNIKF